MQISSLVVLGALPVLVFALDFIERRFGSVRAGWMAGFPIIAAPAMLMLSLEHGPVFAAGAARNALLSVGGWLAFVGVIRVLGGKGGPVFGIVAALGAWFGVGWMLSGAAATSFLLGAALALPVAVALAWGEIAKDGAKRERSTLLRVALAVALVVVVFVLSYVGGERAAGLFSMFPVLAFSLIAPLYLRREFARTNAMTAGMLVAGPSLATFAASVSLLLSVGWSLVSVFGASLIASLVVHLTMWSLISRLRGGAIAPAARVSVGK